MSPDRLNRLYSIFDVRRAAQRVLPQPIFDLIDGGAEDEWTLRRNDSIFESVAFLPKTLDGTQARDLSTPLFGHILKLPLGLVSFTFIVGLLSISLSFLAVPLVWQWGTYVTDFEADGVVLLVDTWGEAWLCALFGLGLLFVSLNLLNGLAVVWRWLATFLLGSERFATPVPPPSSPALPASMALA